MKKIILNEHKNKIMWRKIEFAEFLWVPQSNNGSILEYERRWNETL